MLYEPPIKHDVKVFSQFIQFTKIVKMSSCRYQFLQNVGIYLPYTLHGRRCTTKRKPSSNLIETEMTYIMVLSWTDKKNDFKLGNLAAIQTKYFQNTGRHRYCYKNMLSTSVLVI
jgi:hypothetical protein